MSFPLPLVLSVLLGWLAGVLANWAADRLPAWRRLPSSDRQAGRPRPWLHYWTLGWYFRRNGICPHCGERRPWRAPAVEAVMMAIFLAIAVRFGETPATMVVAWCYTWFLIDVLVIDFETRRVLNVMVVPATVFVIGAGWWLEPANVPSMLAGGVVGFGLFLLLYIIGRVLFGRGALGLGDVKLAGVIGLMTGYPAVMQALLYGALLGGVAALVLLATRRAGLKSTSAYAPYLAVGAMIALWTAFGG